MMGDESKRPIEVAKDTIELIGGVLKIAGDHPDVKSSGSNLAKSAKTLTEFINVGLLPVAAVNFGYAKARSYFEKKFSADIEAIAGDIPSENLQEPRSSIIGPVLQGLAFTHEEDSLKNMYLRLIATAMDNRCAAKAHPAFAEIIKQLSGFEAKLLQIILKQSQFPIVQIRLETHKEKNSLIKFSFPESFRILQTHVTPLTNGDGTPFTSQELPVMVDNWIRLGIVTVSYDTAFSAESFYDWVTERPEYRYWVPQDVPPRDKLSIAKGQLKSTAFGEQFAMAIGAKEVGP
ncbi:MAG TPA: DUF4393 domain-containing protein [Eoetvoesiella sp.]